MTTPVELKPPWLTLFLTEAGPVSINMSGRRKRGSGRILYKGKPSSADVSRKKKNPNWLSQSSQPSCDGDDRSGDIGGVVG